jgi:hypothetical protein
MYETDLHARKERGGGIGQRGHTADSRDGVQSRQNEADIGIAAKQTEDETQGPEP